MKTRAKIGLGTVAALGAAAALATALGERDIGRDAAGSLGIAEPGAFRMALSGPLWRDRTLRDQDGARDIAFVTTDEELILSASGRDGAQVASVTYRIDDGRARVLRRCQSTSCPSTLVIRLRPPLRRLAPGTHRLTLQARGARPGQASSTEIEVTVAARTPSIREGEPVAAPAAPSQRPRRDMAFRNDALRVITGEQRAGALRSVLGVSKVRVVQIGDLQRDKRRIGATVLLSLVTPRTSVRATVPGYLPSRDGYRPQSVEFTASVLRDLLVDVDLERKRVMAIEPGPSSHTSRWAPDVESARLSDED